VEQLKDAHAQQGPIEGGHAVDGPILGVAGDPTVELVHVDADSRDHLDGERIRLHR